jgi:hypothetical protein
MLFATGINLIKHSNLMVTNYPAAIPLEFLHIIHEFSPILYTFTMIFAHTILMGFVIGGVAKLIEKAVENI